MTGTTSGERASTAEQLAGWALFICAALAMVNLPRTELPWSWLLAFTAPAATLGRLPQLGQWPIWRALLATAMQTLACLAALEHSGPLSRPAALACTILPPLAYVCVRRRDADAPLGLFLSFCVLLVGMILGGLAPLLVIAYAFAACLVLRSESLLTSLRYARFRTPGAQPPRALGLLRSTAGLTSICLLFAAAVEHTLAVLPSPSRGAATPNFANRDLGRNRSVGLDDSFVLDGVGGLLSDLHGEQLVHVRTQVGMRVAPDLYLRSGFFATPDLDRWLIGPVALTATDSAEAHRLRRPLRGAAVQWLELERFAGAGKFVLTPPGTTEVRDLADLLVDAPREFLRQRSEATIDSYLVGYQDLPPPGNAPLDPRGEQLGLLTLPAELDPRPFRELMARWDVRGTPEQIAQRIAAGLARHCRYDRLDPTGPFAHAIENFLFAQDDRHGYCMHFASAAALMLRLAGVPCRIGVGLYGGIVDPSDTDARIFGSQHAHAWVEIPYADRGYVVFDPTPPDQRGRGAPTPMAQGEIDVGDSGAGVLLATWNAFVAFVSQPWLLIVVLVAALAATLRPTRRTTIAAKPQPANLRTPRRLLGRILKELARAGHSRQPRETLEQFSRALAARDGLLPELRAAFGAYQEVRFGGRTFDSGKQQLLDRALAAAAAMPSANVDR